MKRMISMLSGILILIIVLSCLLFYAKNTTADESEKSDQKPVEEMETSLACPQRTEMRTIVVVSQEGSYQIALQGETAGITGIAEDYLDTGIIDRVIRGIETLKGQEIADAVHNLEPYGLEKPEAAITVQSSDKTWNVEIGYRIPGEEDARYAVVDHGDKVYRVKGLDDILVGQLFFADRTITKIRAEEGYVPASVEFDGTVRAETITLGVLGDNDREVVPAAWLKVLSKNNYGINYERTTEGLFSLWKIEADAVVSYEPDEKEYAEYGLQEPYSTVSYCWEDINGDSGEYRLSASTPEDGFVYLCREGYPLIYRVDVSLLPWLEWQYEDVITRYLLIPEIYALVSVRISCPEWSETYTLESEGKEVRKVLNSQNREIPVERFKEFYQCLIGIPAENYTETVADAEARTLLEITFVYQDDKESDRITLKEGPPLQVYLGINGKADFLTKSRYVDTILENYRNLLTDKEIIALF